MKVGVLFELSKKSMHTLNCAKLSSLSFSGLFAVLFSQYEASAGLGLLGINVLIGLNLVASFYGVAAVYGLVRWRLLVGRVVLPLNLLFIALHWYQFPLLFGLLFLIQLWQVPTFFLAAGRFSLWNPGLWESDRATFLDLWRERFQQGLFHLIVCQLLVEVYCLVFVQISDLILIIFLFGFLIRNFYLLTIWRALLAESKSWFYIFLIATLIPWLAAAAGYPSLTLSLDFIGCLLILRVISKKHPALSELTKSIMVAPAMYVLVSFAVLSWLGAILLSLPISHATDQSLTALDSFFTAVSAVCVTGLVTIVPHETFSFFGQLILISLIQIGGLGLMVFSSFLTILVGESFGMRREKLISSAYHTNSIRDSKSLVLFIIRATFLIEFIGAAILAQRFYVQGYGWAEAIWKGIFHSISAFCNAGFALQTDSLAVFANDYLALLSSSLLIICGGLGFGVLSALVHKCRHRYAKLDLNTRVVMLMTLSLLPLGAFLFVVTEWNGVLQDYSVPLKLTHGLFYSASLRTAGFSAIDTQLLQPATSLFSMLWMFIGGAPGGTAGGIKVTTVFIFLASLRSLQEKHGRVQALERQFVAADVLRSMVIVIIASSALMVLAMILLWSQTASFLVIFFEAVSAVATVGLSLGLTPDLTALGKVVIIMGMFIGRVGPLTFLFAFEARAKNRISYPRESLMIG